MFLFFILALGFVLLLIFAPPFLSLTYLAFLLFLLYIKQASPNNPHQPETPSPKLNSSIIIETPIPTDYLSQFKEYVVVDLETTGLSKDNDEIIEYAAVRYIDGHQVDYIQSLVNPHVEVPANITRITGITQSMVSDAPDIETALPKLIEYIGDSIVVAHNAPFDIGFIESSAKRHLGLDLDLLCADTLIRFRNAFPQLKNHKLATVAEYLGVKETNYHRALSDAIVTAKCFQFLLDNSSAKLHYTVDRISLHVDLVNALSAYIQQNIKNTPLNDELEYEYDERMEKYAVKSSAGIIGYLPKSYNEVVLSDSNFEITEMKTHINEKQKIIVTVKLNYASLR